MFKYITDILSKVHSLRLEHHHTEAAGHLGLAPGPRLQVVIAGHAGQTHLAHHDAVLLPRGRGPGQHRARPLVQELLILLPAPTPHRILVILYSVDC